MVHRLPTAVAQCGPTANADAELQSWDIEMEDCPWHTQHSEGLREFAKLPSRYRARVVRRCRWITVVDSSACPQQLTSETDGFQVERWPLKLQQDDGQGYPCHLLGDGSSQSLTSISEQFEQRSHRLAPDSVRTMSGSDAIEMLSGRLQQPRHCQGARVLCDGSRVNRRKWRQAWCGQLKWLRTTHARGAVETSWPRAAPPRPRLFLQLLRFLLVFLPCAEPADHRPRARLPRDDCQFALWLGKRGFLVMPCITSPPSGGENRTSARSSWPGASGSGTNRSHAHSSEWPWSFAAVSTARWQWGNTAIALPYPLVLPSSEQAHSRVSVLFNVLKFSQWGATWCSLQRL